MSGQASFVPFARYHRASLSWKTWPLICETALTSYSATWPKQGMTRGGIAYRLAIPWAPHTYVSAFSLLPTPMARDNHGPDYYQSGRRDGSPSLPGLLVVQRAPIAPYLPALDRWQRVVKRARPRAFTTNRDGGPAVAPVFVEWLMGLPHGLVTAVGLSRSRQTSVLGAGVVPQQAEFAIRAMTGLTE